MVEDVRLAVNGARPVEFFSRVGGNVPSHEEVLPIVRSLAAAPRTYESAEMQVTHA